jgi:acyl dehydratase
MENQAPISRVTLTGPETIVRVNEPPSMGYVFLKALMIAPFRSKSIAGNARVNQTRIVMESVLPDPERIQRYKIVCGFSQDPDDIIPVSYLQTLFIGLLGKFITSSFFPINPLGLIQTYQSFEQKRPVSIHETLDLSCSLAGIRKTEKGVETEFSLEVMSGDELVWQGISTYFTRSPGNEKKKTKKKDEKILDPKEIILVPAGTGRQYAGVSGDYNPHHLFTMTAKLFGFKSAIAHGMWSLARVVASLDKQFKFSGALRVDAGFKRPIFMPATTALGYESGIDRENDKTIVDFELRDEQQKIPHLKGRLLVDI